jgi:hypothetical protein
MRYIYTYMSKSHYMKAVVYAVENTIRMYNTIERDLFIENFDLDSNLESFSKFDTYIRNHEQDIYYSIVLLTYKNHKDEYNSKLRSIYNELKTKQHSSKQ